MTKGRIDKAFAGGALPPTIDKAQRASKWQTKQQKHREARERTLARRGLVVVARDDEQAAWDGYLSYANMGGGLNDEYRGWGNHTGGDAA